MASRSRITSKLVKWLVTQLQLSPKEALEHINKDYNVHIHYKMISRALKAARVEVIGNEKEQFGKVRDYLSELHRSNSGIVDVILQPESPPHKGGHQDNVAPKSGAAPSVALDHVAKTRKHKKKLPKNVTPATLPQTGEEIPVLQSAPTNEILIHVIFGKKKQAQNINGQSCENSNGSLAPNPTVPSPTAPGPTTTATNHVMQNMINGPQISAPFKKKQPIYKPSTPQVHEPLLPPIVPTNQTLLTRPKMAT
ncbi:hypothetical protein Ahy_A07g035799 [Arachis hypogaea]|uniref:Uncharacterized protein n=1 Tax=Arachis hypogaea TaxID=3818 RepID=A0A445CEF8_ARAHY|nr:hypothetical protein Ahy_A07g035799 [Arachis hypogaea]